MIGSAAAWRVARRGNCRRLVSLLANAPLEEGPGGCADVRAVAGVPGIDIGLTAVMGKSQFAN